MLYEGLRSKNYDNFNNSIYYGLLAERMLVTIESHNCQMNNILDLCCGTGQLTGKLRNRYPQSNIIGVDISQSMLDVAIANYSNIIFIKQDVNSIALNRKFELISSNFGVQWLKDEFPKNLYNLCSSSTKVIISIPNYGEGTKNTENSTFVGNKVFQTILRLSASEEFKSQNIVKRILSVWKNQFKSNQIIEAFVKNGFTLTDSFVASDYIDYSSSDQLLYSMIARGMFGTVLDDITADANELIIEGIKKDENRFGNLREEIISKWFIFSIEKQSL